MGKLAQAFGFTRGRPGKEPPTPYEFVKGITPGAGVGVSNLVYGRSHTPPLDSVRGRQGINVLRTLNPSEGAVYVNNQSRRYTDAVALANGINTTPELIALYDPHAKQGSL